MSFTWEGVEMNRRRVLLGIAVLTLVAGVLPAAADPYPIIDEPVLRSDTQWIKTDWGYIHQELQAGLPDPEGWDYPTLMTMEGYAGASRPSPNAYVRMDDGELMAIRVAFGAGPRQDYAFVQASIRGTECSAGHFDLYDRRHAMDGYHLVEWIADQPWSNGKVGMQGNSYPGQTAYWVAAAAPPSLKAVMPSLLHSDIYRDIFMPGGVQNILFPSVWTYGTGAVAGPHRIPVDSLESQTIPNDEICTQHQLARYGVGDLPHVENEPIWAGTRAVDDQWYIAHAALTYAPAIKIPYYQQNNWQDEQTGPRAAILWKHINPTKVEICDSDGNERTIVPKKLVTGSGGHGHGGFSNRDRWAFMDIFLLDMCDETGIFDHRVTNYFETVDGDEWTATASGDEWPLEQTKWDKVYLHGDGSIGFAAPTAPEGDRTYLSGVARQNYFWYSYYDFGEGSGAATEPLVSAEGLPDMLSYKSAPLTEDLVITGPILMDLYASIAGTDADFFVSVNEVWPDGSVSYLQRGLLKASHRRVDPERSYYVETDDDEKLLVQPYRPHTNPQPVTPGEVIKYDFEIFPVGHIFRAGNRIQINVHTPPITDGLWG
jgi:putative CocE/NonD family hydrolase